MLILSFAFNHLAKFLRVFLEEEAGKGWFNQSKDEV